MSSYIPNPALRGADPVSVLRLIRTDGIGPMTFFHLLKFCGSVDRAIEMAPALSGRGGRKKEITLTSRAAAEREYNAITKFGAKIVMYGEASYPRLLQTIPDAPPLLMVLGHPHLWETQNIVAMVGARNASANGCAFTRKLASELGSKQHLIVSGLARGIDTHAHTASLATGTVAVIAGGIDTIYPPENEKLYRAIAEAGAIISEAPFGSQPLARSFPARNRIIAGMSAGTLVVEASLKSGSLITAHYALDYGRDVFAVPGSPMDPRAAGTNQLIRDGAIMVESAQDILNGLNPPDKLPLAEPDEGMFEEAAASFDDESTLSEAREAVLAALSATPTLMDDVLVATGLSAHYVMAACLELELAGRVIRHAGAKISLKLGEQNE